MKPIYLDHHASTPLDPEVLAVVEKAMRETYGNASSLQHAWGREANALVENARASVAKLLAASPGEIIFTGGATESDNLAILGAARRYRDKGKHLVTCATEHRAVLDPMRHLESEGFHVTVVPVAPDGTLSPDAISRAMTPETILVSVMAANNEIGTIHPIAEIGRRAKAAGVLFHTDATQAAGKIPIDVNAMNSDLLSLSAHKMHGPKGVGALYVRARSPHVRLEPIVYGGGHENALRSGTLNAPAIAGFGKACDLARERMAADSPRLARLRDRLKDAIISGLDYVTVNGTMTPRLANNLNMSFAFIEAESLLKGLDNIAVSSGAACASAETEPSHVLKALGVSEDIAHGSIRFGLGRFNTEEEIDRAAATIVRLVRDLRALSPLYQMAKEGKLASSVDWTDV